MTEPSAPGTRVQPPGLLAALALLLAASANPSLTGTAFILLFIVWALYAVPYARKPRGSYLARALWGSASALATMVIILQVAVQLAFIAGTPGIQQPAISKLLELLGFIQVTSGPQLALAFGCPIAVLATAVPQSGRLQSSFAASTQHSLAAMRTFHTTPGAFIAVALVGSAFSRPSVLTVPYLAAALTTVHRWAVGAPFAPHSALISLQLYSAAHLVAQYSWQWALSYISWLRPVATFLGLFIIDWQQKPTIDNLQGLLQVASVIALLSATGYFLRAIGRTAPTRGLRTITRLLSPRFPESLSQSGTEPLLGDSSYSSNQEEIQTAEETGVTSSEISAVRISCTSWMSWFVVPAQTLIDLSIAYWLVACSRAGFVSAVVGILAITQPSILGGILLLLAVSVLHTGASHIPRPLALFLFVFLSIWTAADFVLTATEGFLQLPALVSAIGFRAVDSGAPLALMFAVTCAAGCHVAWQRDDNASIMQKEAALNKLRRAWETCLLPNGHEGAGDSTPLQIQCLYSLLAVSSIALPPAMLVAGSLRYDVLHGVLLLGLLSSLLCWNLCIRPSIRQLDVVQSRSVFFAKAYAAFALALLYCCYVGSFEIFGGLLQPANHRAVLEVLGLWDPRIVDMSGLLAILLMASAHRTLEASMVDALGRASTAHPPTVKDIPTWRPVWLIKLSRLASGYGALLLVALVYAVVLLDCDVAAFGWLYLAFAVWILAKPPVKGIWQERGATFGYLDRLMLGQSSQAMGVSVAPAPKAVLINSPFTAWVPLMLSGVVAGVDFALQASLPAIARAQVLDPGIMDFLSMAIGIDGSAQGLDLFKRLARPALFLISFQTYRWMYTLGTLHRQLHLALTSAHHLEIYRLAEQWTLIAFVKRFFIIHGSKLVALGAFCVAMQTPSAIGWLLVTGVVTCSPFLGAPSSGTVTRRQPFSALLLAAQIVSSLWFLGQYAVRVPWVAQVLASQTYLQGIIAWAGVQISNGSLSLEALLRLKALFLAAVAVKQRSFTWHAKLPAQVKEAANCGAPCPMFWPPGPQYTRHNLPMPPEEEREDVGQEERGGEREKAEGRIIEESQSESDYTSADRGSRSLLANLSRPSWPLTALRTAADRARDAANAAMEAAAQGAVEFIGGSHQLDGYSTDDYVESSSDETQASLNQGSTSPPSLPDANSIGTSRAGHGIAFRFAAQDWLERFYSDWGLELSMLALLLAAFANSNALSLVLIAAVGAGMAAPDAARRALWKWALMPVLAAFVLWQYSLRVGSPPDLLDTSNEQDHDPLQSSYGSSRANDDDMSAWLALNGIPAAALWSLFVAFGGTVLQCHYDSWSACSARQSPPEDSSHEADESLQSPLLSSSSHSTVSNTCLQLWAPLTPERRSSWAWHDRVRFYVYRRYFDFLLIAVVALCTLDTDFVHLGYLALALYFFRSRLALRSRRGAMFWYLPAYNFAVMTMLLLYQAPFVGIWDLPLDDGTRACSAAHLLGLFKIKVESSRSMLNWGFCGAGTDLALWAFIRLQSHLFSSRSYDLVVALVEAEEEMERSKQQREISNWQDAQAAAALEESRQRASRARRIRRIQAGVGKTLERFGAGVEPTTLDFAFIEENAHEERLKQHRSGSLDDGKTHATHRLRNRRGGKSTAPSTPREVPLGATQETARGSDPTTLPSGSPVNAKSPYDAMLHADSGPPTSRPVPSGGSGVSGEIPMRPWFGRLSDWMAFRLRRADRRESAAAYALFSLAYLWDLGLLTMILPLSAWLYALVAPRPTRTYWRLALLWCEALIVACYAWQVLARLECGFLTPARLRTAELLGIHENAARCIPLFLAYLATLQHTEGLLARHAAGRRVAETSAAHLRTSNSLQDTRHINDGVHVRAAAQDIESGIESATHLPDTSTALHAMTFPQGRRSLRTYCLDVVAAAWEFVLHTCTSCERAPSLLLLELRVAKPALAALDGAMLEHALQAAIDHPSRRNFNAENQPHGTDEASLELTSADASSRLLVTFHSFVSKYDTVDFSGDNAAEQLQLDDARANSPHDDARIIRALFTATALPPVASHGSIISLMRRCMRPASLAAKKLLDETLEVSANATPIAVISAEAHGRRARDYYAATAALDILAFFFSALWYSRISQAAGSLSEITSQHAVPLGYLLTLITLFLFIVLDRVVYTLGNPAGKACLHVVQLALWLWYCSSLVWSAGIAPSSFHLRVLLGIKTLSVCLGALQLRSGYPPPASYSDGFGRQTLIFTRSLSPASSICFRVFTAIPFIYELRQLLDWACTATTLTLYDYFKLEDINLGLYTAAIMRTYKAGKPHGARQPRHVKLLQGGLLFIVLLLLLWAPLLVFSTGAPTYQAPSVTSVSLNITLLATNGRPRALMPVPKLRSQLFHAGERAAWVPWAGDNDTLPEGLAVGYTTKQLQLTCLPKDADSIWRASPPTVQAIAEALQDKAANVAIAFSWTFVRDLPPPSDRGGGPECQGTAIVPLATSSRLALLQTMLNTSEKPAVIVRQRTLDGSSSSALFRAFWLLRGDTCEARPLDPAEISGGDVLPGRRVRPDMSWSDRWLACNASLQSDSTGAPSAGSQWWRWECAVVNGEGGFVDEHADQRATCPDSVFGGPQVIGLLDRVQAGVLGATLNKYGVLGLYSVVVLGLGRFIRLSFTNLRMRIPYEDLPTTRRLMAVVRDIYIARAEGLLDLEEELYNALLAVYRLPSVMYELTKKDR